MKKYIILISIFIFNSMAFSNITLPVMSVFTRIEGKHNKTGSALLSTVGIEFMLGKEIYLYTQIRATCTITGKEKEIERSNGFYPADIGGLIGMGGYLFDKRNDDGKGWAMAANGAVGIDLSIISKKYFKEHAQKEIDTLSSENPMDALIKMPTSILSMYAESIAYMYRIPLEINMYARYNISKRFALQIGLSIGSDIAFEFYNDDSIKPYYGGFRYGASVGLAF